MPFSDQPAVQGNGGRLSKEIARRRTFAIISHPDAGKTTLTEKLLLYGNAIGTAGAVRARGVLRNTASDWMEMEKQRGISVSATALEMDYNGYRINLLDTPGHQDFSEDTYRTLMAVDSAVMVLDGGKGVEPQTEKLFKVCRMRGIPILTFINKMDRPGMDPLELLDEVERVLGISAVPVNWPVGDGPSFQGVYNLKEKQVLRFQRTVHGQFRAPVEVAGLDDPELFSLLGDNAARSLIDYVALLDGVVGAYSKEKFLSGEMTPVFFGSALNNFGIEPFLDAILGLMPPPAPQVAGNGIVNPAGPEFSGFIFKVQANLDPRHRDRMAFMRICSGHFRKDMLAHNPRLGKDVRLSRAFKLFGQEREPIEEAFPGDVIGIISPGLLSIGDTLTTGKPFRFAPIPRFAPEHFALLANRDITRYKQFNTGLAQLEEEGAVQVLYTEGLHRREPVMAAVGILQFDLILSRLQEEYGVTARAEHLPYSIARWVSSNSAGFKPASLARRSNMVCRDSQGRAVILFSGSWDFDYCRKENPELNFSELG